VPLGPLIPSQSPDPVGLTPAVTPNSGTSAGSTLPVVVAAGRTLPASTDERLDTGAADAPKNANAETARMAENFISTILSKGEKNAKDAGYDEERRESQRSKNDPVVSRGRMEVGGGSTSRARDFEPPMASICIGLDGSFAHH